MILIRDLSLVELNGSAEIDQSNELSPPLLTKSHHKMSSPHHSSPNIPLLSKTYNISRLCGQLHSPRQNSHLSCKPSHNFTICQKTTRPRTVSLSSIATKDLSRSHLSCKSSHYFLLIQKAFKFLAGGSGLMHRLSTSPRHWTGPAFAGLPKPPVILRHHATTLSQCGVWWWSQRSQTTVRSPLNTATTD